MRKVTAILALLLAGCAVPRAEDYKGTGYGKDVKQAYAECVAQLKQDILRAGARSADDAVVMRMNSDIYIDACMAGKGYAR